LANLSALLNQLAEWDSAAIELAHENRWGPSHGRLPGRLSLVGEVAFGRMPWGYR
jgi:hypothetical protein